MATIRPFRASFPSLDNIEDKQDFFDKAKSLFPEYLARKIYNLQDEEGFYIYENTIQDISFTGLICLSSLKDYINGDIVRHEHTIKTKEKIMLNLMAERQALIKPVVLTYPEDKEITTFLFQLKKKYDPVMSVFYLDGLHRVWPITAREEIDQIAAFFKERVGKTYIGDGHHRAATSLMRYQKFQEESTGNEDSKSFDCLLSALFSSDQLRIHEINRIVETLNGHSPEELIIALREKFFVEGQFEPSKPKTKYEIGMYLDKKWYLLTPKQSLLKGLISTKDQLAVSIWNDHVLKILGIEDPRTDKRIKYVDGEKGVEKVASKVGKNAFAVGFTFFPVALEDLMAIADAGDVMPPKSTWFTPRMRNGLVVHQF